MPRLTFLNGSTVDALERRDSELHYLRGLLTQAEERPAQLQVQAGVIIVSYTHVVCACRVHSSPAWQLCCLMSNLSCPFELAMV